MACFPTVKKKVKRTVVKTKANWGFPADCWAAMETAQKGVANCSLGWTASASKKMVGQSTQALTPRRCDQLTIQIAMLHTNPPKRVLSGAQATTGLFAAAGALWGCRR
jgi:hypothetical protein